GQVGHQVLGHRHRAHSGPAATVRDAERLVQVQVGDVATETARPAPADQRVQVGAVDVHLATCGVHQLAQLGDPGLVDPVRGGVGDHDGGDAALVLGQHPAQVLSVHVAVVGGGHDRHLQ